VNEPEICTRLPVMPGLIVGADCTTPSSSIATCLLTYGCATLSTNSFVLNVISVTYDDVFVSYWLDADETLRPFSTVGPSR
jgi:hypothetical protein